MRKHFEIFREPPQVLLAAITVTQKRLSSLTSPKDLIRIWWQIVEPIKCFLVSPVTYTCGDHMVCIF